MNRSTKTTLVKDNIFSESFLNLCCFCFLVSPWSCTTTHSLDQEPKLQQKKTVSVKTTGSQEPRQSLTPEPASENQESMDPGEIRDFLNRHSRIESSLTQADKHFLFQLREGNREPLGEAALVLGLCQMILDQTWESSLDQQPTEGEVTGLETLSHHYKLNLLNVLKTNRQTHSPSVLMRCLNALEVGTNSEAFNTAIRSEIRKQASRWADMLKQFGNESDLPLNAEVEDEPETPASAAAADVNALGNLRSADELLLEAQSFADKGEFAIAIQKSRLVPEESAMFETAQERILLYSNRGIQELRRKAAIEFQSAGPIRDPKVRASYLRKARKYLETAIDLYPNAEHVETVRANLQVIVRDLEQLDIEEENTENAR